MNITYGMIEEHYSLGNDMRISYGVAAYTDVSQEGTASILASFHDITSDRLRIASLINNCNRLKISIIHFEDVIEDFLVD